jgi:hypothetical protein
MCFRFRPVLRGLVREEITENSVPRGIEEEIVDDGAREVQEARKVGIGGRRRCEFAAFGFMLAVLTI